MKPTSVTVGVPVRDLDAAIAWYRRAFDLAVPDQRPLPHLAEFDLGVFWLQLALDIESAGRGGIALNMSITDARAERNRFAELGVDVSELRTVEGVVDYFEIIDPDGNRIGFVTELD